MWQRRASVSHRSVFEVLKFTWIVEPVGLYGSSTALMGRSPIEARVDAGGDPLAGHIRQHLVHELRRIGAALAHQTRSSHCFGDALELAEEVQLGFLAGVTPLGEEQARASVRYSNVERPHIAGMNELEFHFLADDPGILGHRSAQPDRGSAPARSPH